MRCAKSWVLADEKTAHGKASEALSHKTLECTQLAQQVLDLQERIAAEERHRQWLELRAKHQTTEAIRALNALRPDVARASLSIGVGL